MGSKGTRQIANFELRIECAKGKAVRAKTLPGDFGLRMNEERAKG